VQGPGSSSGAELACQQSIVHKAPMLCDLMTSEDPLAAADKQQCVSGCSCVCVCAAEQVNCKML
jgi:hypothetical protein